jgi:uncharacterized protein YbaR (Trm112 family)
MRVHTAVCPNCDGWLETHRKEVQPAGRRQVYLHWVICPACRHVALYEWSFSDEHSPVTITRSNGRQPT